MAADDEQTPDPDPWADLQADDLEAGAGEISFQFEGDPQPPVADEAVVPAESDASALPSGSAEDDAAQAWLAEADGSAVDAAGTSGDAIEIGTGLSGIEGLEAEAGAAEDEVADDMLAAVEPESSQVEAWGDFGAPVGGEAGEVATETPADAEASADADAGGFDFSEPDAGAAAVVPVAAAAAAAAAAAPRRAKAAPRKQAGGLGQMIGVVAGGVMAIPITLAILIWGLQKDPFGVTKMVPEQAAFLLPQKFRPGFKKAKAAAGMTASKGGSPLDAVASTGDAPASEPAPEEAALPAADLPVADLPVPDLTELAAVEPAVPAPVDEPVDAGASDPVETSTEAAGDEGTVPDVATAAAADANEPPPVPDLGDVAAVVAPGLDSLPAEPAAPPEPAPLDTAALDAALADARALGEALAAVEDRSARPARLLTVQWYQALARVAEQLASLERTAADAGRPLSETPEQVSAFHAALIGSDPQLADLGRVAWDWLAFRKRQGDGVVLPVTFASARRVGPYWSATATLDKGDGTRRALSIVSRSEPAAVAGDRLLVTGLVLGDNVIWAADWRSAAGEPQAGEMPAEPAPVAEPAAEPAAETAAEPTSEPMPDPVPEPAAPPSDEPAEPITEPAEVEPAAGDPAAEPAAGSEESTEPVAEGAAPF